MIRGVTFILLAEFCFAVATVFAKYITRSSDIPAIEITFFRFLIGFFVSFFYIRKHGDSFKPAQWRLVLYRAVFSFTALILFFYSVQYTSVTNANMLNMTYPVFVFIIAPLFWKQKIRWFSVLFLLLTITGIYLVIRPDFSHINIGDIWGLLSGIVAAFAVITLSIAREHDSTAIIVFYLMVFGFILNGIMMIPSFIMPHGIQFIHLLASGAFGVMGQTLLTIGYKTINARTGSMISSSRIVFAAILGFTLFSDPLNLSIITGGLLIVGSIIGISLLHYNKHL
jgi:drug/metabolite transporter (DMT)-like permease